jgi:DNA-binding NarL/FixJ family response regulator
LKVTGGSVGIRPAPSGRTVEQLVAELNRLDQQVRAIQAEIEDLVHRERRSPRRQTTNRPPLTEREMQVLRAMAWGFATKEIADQLKIGEKSVGTYRARAFRKLGLESRADLVRYAVRHGWMILSMD